MSEQALRNRLIRLAHANPRLRPYLLPLLTKQAGKAPAIADALSRLLSPKSPAKMRGKILNLAGRDYLIVPLSDGHYYAYDVEKVAAWVNYYKGSPGEAALEEFETEESEADPRLAAAVMKKFDIQLYEGGSPVRLAEPQKAPFSDPSGKKFRFPEGTYTQKEWVSRFAVRVEMVKVEWKDLADRRKLNRLDGHQTEEYVEKLKEKAKTPLYWAYTKDNLRQQVTKETYLWAKKQGISAD